MTKSILDYIHHPLTNKKIETRSATGKKIIAKYVSVIDQIGGNDTLNLNPLIDYKFEIAERNKQLKLLDEIQDKSILRNELDKIGIDHSGKHSLWILKTLARDWLLGEEYIHTQIMINKLNVASDSYIKNILEQNYQLPVKHMSERDARMILREIILKEYDMDMINSDIISINTNCQHFKPDLSDLKIDADTKELDNMKDYYNCASIQLNRLRSQRKND